MEVFLIVASLCFVAYCYCIFMLIRNRCIYAVRLQFLNDDELWRTHYEALPEYDQMLENPKYWLLWTPEHWIEWVNRQEIGVHDGL